MTVRKKRVNKLKKQKIQMAQGDYMEAQGTHLKRYFFWWFLKFNLTGVKFKQ